VIVFPEFFDKIYMRYKSVYPSISMLSNIHLIAASSSSTSSSRRMGHSHSHSNWDYLSIKVLTQKSKQKQSMDMEGRIRMGRSGHGQLATTTKNVDNLTRNNCEKKWPVNICSISQRNIQL
jgi:hypothetical protein